jgi:uncharacterized protein
MSAPFFKFGLFGADTSLVVAFVIGIGFGFFLERAGFGSARKLVSQFYLDDLAVFKVMFTAIVTAMLGVTYLSWIGVLDLSQVYLVPTYLAPQVAGGVLLGFGFVIGGYCPGTSIAATATGKIDGLIYVLGVVAGTVLFAEAYPLVRALHLATPFGQTTIPQYFNLPYGLVALAVVLMAVGGFAGATWVERWMAAKSAGPAVAPQPRPPVNRRLALAALALGVIAVFARPMTGTTATFNTQEVALGMQRGDQWMQPRELADAIIKGTEDLRLIDVSDEGAFASYHVPGAENVPVAGLVSAGLARTEKIVLCSSDGSEAAQAWVLLRGSGFNGARVLRGGIEGWKREVLFPVLKAGSTSSEQQENARFTAISARFGGTPRTAADAQGGAVTAAVLPAIGMPKVEAPVLPAGGAKPAVVKKKKEGC